MPERVPTAGSERFEVLPEQCALRAGETLRGVVRIQSRTPLRIARLWVEVTGRELVNSPARHTPGVYRHPVHRPWGRTRTGAATVDFEQRVALLGEPRDRRLPTRLGRGSDSTGGVDEPLPAGLHNLPFAVALPPGACPTYRGVGVVVEQDLTAHLELVGGRMLHAWAPLHLWQGPVVEALPAEPLAASSADRRDLLTTATGFWRTPVELRLTVPNGYLRVGDSLRLHYQVTNPYRVRLGHLAFELEAREVSRYRAATDDERYRIARLELRTNGDEPQGELAWQIGDRLAPTLTGHRFKLTWRLRGSLLIPWRLGPAVELPLTVVDPPPVVQVRELGEEARS